MAKSASSASTAGGPGFLVNDDCGIRVPPVDPVQYAEDLAKAIICLCRDREYTERLSRGARQRIADVAVWDKKIEWLLSLYADLVGNQSDAS